MLRVLFFILDLVELQLVGVVALGNVLFLEGIDALPVEADAVACHIDGGVDGLTERLLVVNHALACDVVADADGWGCAEQGKSGGEVDALVLGDGLEG